MSRTPLSSQIYRAMPKRIQYLISLFKKQIRRYGSDRKAIEKQDSLIQDKLKQLKGKRSLKVLFLAIYDSMWKYDSIYQQMLVHPQFEPQLLVCKAQHLSSEEALRLQESTMNSFKSKGYSPIAETLSLSAAEQLEADFVFYSSPYEEQYSPGLRQASFPQALSCYALYGYPLEDYRQWYDLLFHNRLWRYFLVSDYDLQSYKKLSRTKGSNGFVSGSPHLDAFVARQEELPKQSDELPLVIIAPHHSIEAWGYSLSNFLHYHQTFIDLSDKYRGRLRFAFKPHPVLKTKLYKLNNWGQERTDAYYRYWQTQTHCRLEEGPYIDLFLSSDALVHDCSAFTAEYQIVAKPALFMRKNKRLPKGLNQAAKEAFTLHEMADSGEDIDRFLEAIALRKPDQKHLSRKDFQKRHLLPPNGTSAAQAILDELVATCR